MVSNKHCLLTLFYSQKVVYYLNMIVACQIWLYRDMASVLRFIKRCHPETITRIKSIYWDLNEREILEVGVFSANWFPISF